MKGYAVVSTGGKQYKVSAGDLIDVELLDIEENAQEVVFNSVLFGFDGQQVRLGKPEIEGASVKADIVGFVRGAKVVAYKYKKRKNYHRKLGHRQNYVRVRVRELVI